MALFAPGLPLAPASAGQAASGRELPVLAQRSGAVFYELAGARAASPGTGMMSGTLTVNPYVGCEMSCSYCYAPYAHGWLVERLRAGGRLPADPALPSAFDRAIFVKRAAEDVVRAVARHPGWPVVLGTATDPYQPAERRFGVTRGILEGLARLEGIQLSITTKGPLVVRDLDLLERIAERSRVSVHLSLISVDARLLRLVEPRSPTPVRRLEALRRLRERGIRAGVFAMPMLPGITDAEEQIDALFAAARQADACFVVAGGVRLSSVAWKRFLPALRRVRPDLERAYQEIVRDRTSPRRALYRRRLDERIARCRARHGFGAGREWADRPAPREPQLSLL
jgi:DNA repair photolyase